MKTCILTLTTLLPLTALLPAEMRQWSGGSNSTSNWSDRENWVERVVPQEGDWLVFPPGSARLANQNDLPPRTFSALTIGAESIAISGNDLNISSSINVAADGGFIRIHSRVTLAGDVEIRRSGSITLELRGEMNVRSNLLTLIDEGSVAGESGWIELSGRLTGTGDILCNGSGYVIFGGSLPTGVGGLVRVSSGTLVLNRTSGFAVAGELRIDPYASVWLMQSNQFSADSKVTVKDKGWLRFDENATDTTIGALEMRGGGCTGTAASRLRVRGGLAAVAGNSELERIRVTFASLTPVWDVAAGATVTATGQISDSGGGITFTGAGRTQLRAPASLQWATLTGGEVEFTGDNSETAILLNGGVLTGIATVGQIRSDYTTGAIMPGASGSGGILTCRDLVLNSALRVRVAGANGLYGRLAVTGTARLGSLLDPGHQPWLTFEHGGYVPVSGESYSVLTMAQPGPIAGQFAGFPEGGRATINDVIFNITYRGGVGQRDTVLTVAGIEPTGVVREWMAPMSADGRWNAASNWRSGVIPRQGDLLRFPPGAFNQTPLHDLPATWSFAGISAESGYAFTGDRLLAGSAGITAISGPVPVNVGFASIELTHDARFETQSGGRLRVEGPVNTRGRALTLRTAAGGGLIDVRSPVTGSGELIKDGAGPAIIAARIDMSQTTVDDGLLQLEGDTGAVRVRTRHTGHLAVSGRIGALNAEGGTISPGRLYPVVQPGIMMVTSCELAPDATLAIEIGGPESGAGRLVSGGTMALNRATLQVRVTGGAVLAMGSTFVVVELTDPGQSPQSIFNNQPPGSLVVALPTAPGAAAQTFRINYAGGDGNDVTLRRVPVPAVSFDRSDVPCVKWVWDESREHRSLQIAARGLTGVGYHVEAAFDLSAGPWSRLTTGSGIIADEEGGIAFWDHDADLYPRRFYRFVSPR